MIKNVLRHKFWHYSFNYMNVHSYLLSALNNIEWAHKGVCDTAWEDTSNHAFSVVAHVVNVTSGHLDYYVDKIYT